jgi:phage terminase large subunit
MTKVLFKTTDLYNAVANDNTPIIVSQGGTSSGKTYSFLQNAFTKCIEDKVVFTCVGQDMPNLKVGAIRDSLQIIDSSALLQRFISDYNKSDQKIIFNNGSILEFKSYKDGQDARSGKRDYLFVNEANGISYDIYEQLSLRTTRQEYIDYNPTAQFWVHEKIIPSKKAKLFITDHRHNPFVLQSIRDKIEALIDKDEELWRVYARGMTGKIEGLVFRDWKVCEKIPEGAKFIGIGLDFGFTNDPTSAVEVYQQDGQLWINELFYYTNKTNQDISALLKECGVDKSKLIIADCAEPKSIEELRRMGWTIEPSIKGADSINISISVLKNYRLNITNDSTNLRKELMNYKWKVDRLTNSPTNTPVDFFNHGIDALRYVAMNKLRQSHGKIRSSLV